MKCDFCGNETRMVVRDNSRELFHCCKDCKEKNKDLLVCVIFLPDGQRNDIPLPETLQKESPVNHDPVEYQNFNDPERCVVCNDPAEFKLYGRGYCHGCYADFKHELRKGA